MSKNFSTKVYGVYEQNISESYVERAVEELSVQGFTIIDSGYSLSLLNDLSDAFNSTYLQYLDAYGIEKLKAIDEFFTIRALFTLAPEIFLPLIFNENLLAVVKNSIKGQFILNQQNGIINPPKEKYNQGAWHRDFPYQHFVTSRPLGINALFCLDDFTSDNGATSVLPSSHKEEAFLSDWYVNKNAIQLEAKAGSFILFDCMLYHSGSANKSLVARRAINHVFNIPYFKQQINIPKNMVNVNLTAGEKDILGFNFQEPGSITDYLLQRKPN